jgi:hypothetical protein
MDSVISGFSGLDKSRAWDEVDFGWYRANQVAITYDWHDTQNRSLIYSG